MDQPIGPRNDLEEPYHVTVLGFQRTGSTWIKQVVHRAIDGQVRGGRLHRPVAPDAADRFVVIMRDPWAWLVSFYTFQLHPVFGFIDKWWNKVLHPPVDEWRAFRWWNAYLLAYENWRSTLPEDRTAWLHYEQLLPDPSTDLADALTKVGLPVKAEIEQERSHVKDFSSPLSKILSPEALRSKGFDPTYYTEKRYLEAYRPSHMRTLMDMAERRDIAERFAAFGYDMQEDVPAGDT